MSSNTRIELSILAVIVVLLSIPFLLPVNLWRGPIERAASSALGRDVRISGPIHLSVYPDIGLRLSDVSVANPPGSQEPVMVKAGSVIVGAEILPLLSGTLQVTELTLQDARIDLESSDRGTPNWSFGDEPATGRKANAAALNRIGFAHINLRHSDIIWRDTDDRKSVLFKDVSLSLDMPDAATPTLALPLAVNGSLTYNGERLNLAGQLDNFADVVDGRGTSAKLSVSSNIINAEFQGMVSRSNLSGALKLGAHSVRSCAAWLGNPLPQGNGFGLLALEGEFAARDGEYTLSHAHLAFDSMNVNGDLTIDTRPKRLTIKGAAAVDRVDVNPYLAPGASDDTVVAQKARAANPDAPLALSGLRSVDAELTLVVGGLVLPDMKLDQAIVKANLTDGLLNAQLNNIVAFGGKGKTSLVVDARGDEPEFHQTLDITGVKAQPFLAELVGVKKITGNGAVRFEISSHGNTPREIVRHLAGRGDINLSNGSVAGTDLAAVARILETVLSGQIPSQAVGDSAQTPFGSLSADFVLENGVMHSRSVRLLNPKIEIDGSGDVDFAGQQLDLHFNPKPAPGMHKSGIGVPFFVKGSWRKPHFGPDTGTMAKQLLKRVDSTSNVLDLLTKPGLSLKSVFGRQKPVD